MIIEPTSGQYVVRAVKEDLRYLKEEWTQDISDQSQRISSVILRRLLVENTLGKAWILAGFDKEPLIRSFGLGSLMSSIGTDRITFAQAGGANFKGAQVDNLFEIQGSLTYNKPHRQIPIEYSLSQFVESICIIVEGQIIRRREVINYVSNKLGGVHTDTRRGISGTEKQFQKEKVYLLLDNILRRRITLNKNAVFYELPSIGQSLIDSKDIKMFLEKPYQGINNR